MIVLDDTRNGELENHLYNDEQPSKLRLILHENSPLLDEIIISVGNDPKLYRYPLDVGNSDYFITKENIKFNLDSITRLLDERKKEYNELCRKIEEVKNDTAFEVHEEYKKRFTQELNDLEKLKESVELSTGIRKRKLIELDNIIAEKEKRIEKLNEELSIIVEQILNPRKYLEEEFVGSNLEYPLN